MNLFETYVYRTDETGRLSIGFPMAVHTLSAAVARPLIPRRPVGMALRRYVPCGTSE